MSIPFLSHLESLRNGDEVAEPQQDESNDIPASEDSEVSLEQLREAGILQYLGPLDKIGKIVQPLETIHYC